MNNNEKQSENLAILQQLKNLPIDSDAPPALILENHQSHLIDNFDLIKQRYSSLADFQLSRGLSKFFLLFLFFIEKKISFQMENN